MKRYKDIYPKVWAYENLYHSWRKAARGKRKAPEVADFEYYLTDNLLQLEQELKTQTYRPGPYRHFHITCPKLRRISAAPFRDRVVHHALVRQIEPIFEARFSRDSYACRVGKGTHAALERCRQYARQYRYVLQCDIVQFFTPISKPRCGAGWPMPPTAIPLACARRWSPNRSFPGEEHERVAHLCPHL